jgi:3-hydroxyisobutyrate dehydrogenase-like beta-hydroxyacid dehydrogenase
MPIICGISSSLDSAETQQDHSMKGKPMSDAISSVGFVGFGDQGAPIARAIAEGGFTLHVWARRPSSLDALDGVQFTVHETIGEMAAASDLVGLCLSEDTDNRQLMIDGGLLAAMKPGAILVNHGTGLPKFAEWMTTIAAPRDIDVLDAPVSGGHAGAVAKQLTTIVGGDPAILERARPVFETFSKKIAHMGTAGAGQVGKLINNALLMANQKNIDDMLEIARAMDVKIPELIDVLRSGTASSVALQVLGSAITVQNADHLSKLQLIDMEIFAEAVEALGATTETITRRAVDGANALPRLAKTIVE